MAVDLDQDRLALAELTYRLDDIWVHVRPPLHLRSGCVRTHDQEKVIDELGWLDAFLDL
jgi:hypothetical protein